jgi:minor extracellular serine protease Vpr
MFPMYGAATDKKVALGKEQVSIETLKQMKKIISGHKAILGRGPVLHEDLQNLTGDEEVSVIVQLSEMPVAMVKGMNKISGKTFSAATEKNVQQRILTEQQTFEKQLITKIAKARIGFTYSYAFNGMSLKVKASQVKDLLNIEGVTLVEPDLKVRALAERSSDEVVSPLMNSSAPYLKIPEIWDLGYEGQNVKVAVLDTGIDYNHPEFEGVYKGGYNFVSHALGYERPRAANDPYETSPLDRPANQDEFDEEGNSFYTDHGTHVAGTIAAQGKNPFGIKGIAPKIELYAYRILGAYGTGTYSSLIAGIDKAAAEKMDIINLSLGGDTNSQTTADAIAINNAVLAGTTAVIATGNSGSERSTIGSPSTAAFGIAVGNSTVPSVTKQSVANVQVEGLDPSSHSLSLLGWKFGANPGESLTGTYEVKAVPNFGVDSDYTGLNVTGKVALVSRGGGISFDEKIVAAKKAGAVATIIHNNGTGGDGPAGVYLGDTFTYIPAFDMSTTDGNALRAALQTKTATVTFSNFTNGSTAGDEINNSSSRGPSNPNFDVKPDVSAPGTNIMSTIPAYKKDVPEANYAEAYARFTGTSMATPHVAGIAALLKSKNPDWSPFDIKVAITNTAKQLDTTKYDVFAQGAGLVQPDKAITAEALAYALDQATFSGSSYDHKKGTITFGNIATGSATAVTKEVLIKNLTGNPSDYQVSVQVTKQATGELAGTTVTVDEPTFTLTSEKTLKVTLNVPAGAGSDGNEIQGYIHITNGSTNLSLPFAANFAPLTGLKSFSMNSVHISPNGDGKLDTTNVNYEFHDPQYTTYLELWDAQNPEGGPYGDGYLGWFVNNPTTSVGPKTVTFNGSYTPWGQPPTMKNYAPDGVYTVDLSTINAGGSAFVVLEWIGPVYIKSTATKIVANDGYETVGSSYNFSGSLEDSYIDFAPTVEEVFGIDYDVNEHLHPRYVLTNSLGEIVDSNTITLAQDGTFNLNLDGLTLGENKLQIIVDDAAQNHAEKEIIITSTKGAPKALTVTPDQVTLEAGQSQQLAVTATYSIGDEDVTDQVTFSGYNSEVITVENGKITAVAAGTTELAVQFEGLQATVSVTVNAVPDPVPTALTVTPAQVTLEAGQNQQLTVKATYSTGDEDVTNQASYSGYNPAVVTVENGKITAVAAGETNILVEFEGLQATVAVTVNAVPDPDPVPTALTVTPTQVTLEAGQNQQLAVKATYSTGDEDVTNQASYSGYNPAVVTVENGKITAVAAGETNILVEFEGLQATVVVKVNPLVTPDPVLNSLTVTPQQVTLSAGQNHQLQVKATYSTGVVDVTNRAAYSGYNPGVITVENGKITAVAAGETNVDITFEGFQVSVAVKVNAIVNPGPDPDPGPNPNPVPNPVPNPGPITPPGLPGKIVVNPNTGEITFEVDGNLLRNFIDPTKNDIVVNLSTLFSQTNKVSTKVSADILTTLAGLKKNVVINTGSETIVLPADILAELAFAKADNVTFSIGKMAAKDASDTKGQNSHSDVLDLNIEFEKGNQKIKFASFKTPVKVTVSVKGKTFKDKRKVAAYYLNEKTGKWVYVGGKVAGDQFTFTTNHFSKFVVIENNTTFADIQKHWAKNEIEVLASRNIIQGKEANLVFAPGEEVTRGQFTILLARALNLPIDAHNGIFKDVPQNAQWAYQGIEAAYRVGIVKGKTVDTFGINDKITREQMALMLIRAIEYKDKTILQNVKSITQFKDQARISANARDAVQQAQALDLIKGTNGFFAPKEYTTRAQSAVVLYRLLHLLKEIE